MKWLDGIKYELMDLKISLEISNILVMFILECKLDIVELRQMSK